jgi:hypothetical protein
MALSRISESYLNNVGPDDLLAWGILLMKKPMLNFFSGEDRGHVESGQVSLEKTQDAIDVLFFHRSKILCSCIFWESIFAYLILRLAILGKGTETDFIQLLPV